MNIRFSDVTSPFYDEAQIASVLFSDFDTLPLKPYRDMINLLFKSCKKELKRALKLSNFNSKETTKVLLAELRNDFNGFKDLKRGKTPEEEVAETAETLPSVMPDSELSPLKREP